MLQIVNDYFRHFIAVLTKLKNAFCLFLERIHLNVCKNQYQKPETPDFPKIMTVWDRTFLELLRKIYFRAKKSEKVNSSARKHDPTNLAHRAMLHTAHGSAASARVARLGCASACCSAAPSWSLYATLLVRTPV